MHATTNAWYTTQYITNCLKQFLREKGFRISEAEEENPPGIDSTVIANRLLSREIIEIRGTIKETATESSAQLSDRNESGFSDVVHFLRDMMVSPINFFNFMNGNEGDRCLCLPDIQPFRDMLEKLSRYFVSNNLQFKVYLVDQSGAVEIVDLNPEKKDRA